MSKLNVGKLLPVSRITDMYTSFTVAKDEIKKRWADTELRNKVDEYLGGDVPDFLMKQPRAYLARPIASPNFETLRFLALSELLGLEVAMPDFGHDKFSSANIDKYHLARMFFYDGVGKHGGARITTSIVIDFNKAEGQELNKVITIWNENFVSFHHRILNLFIPGVQSNVFDVSAWLKRNGGKPQIFYKKLFALFLANGVMFENFLTNKDEQFFTETVILPSFNYLYEKFGIKPLIVPISPLDDELSLYWRSYPAAIMSHLGRARISKKLQGHHGI